MPRHDLASTLIDIADAALAARASLSALYARRVEMELPLQITWRDDVNGTTLYAHLPSWRWRTVFDQTPSRVRVTWYEGEIS